MRASTKLRQLMREPGIIVAPGAYDTLTAKIVEQAGFGAVYMTGAGVSATHIGQPDLGLATLTEMVSRAAAMTETVDVPVIADADTGYGGPINIHRTVRQYERAGVAALHIEDQEFPKRCGHLDDKKVISTEDMVQKIRAAVNARTDDDMVIIVRTDAIAVTGMDDTLVRCEEYVKAGADVLFVEALRTNEDIERVMNAVDVPLLYNFVESGKSPLIPTPELERLGFKFVIFPGSAMFTVCHVVAQVMRELKERGTTEHLMDSMVSVHDFFETVGLSEMLELDARFASPQPVG